jgi:hypothetical protein
MQKMVEAWQAQAKNTHAELSTVLRQAEQLKSLNAQLSSRASEVTPPISIYTTDDQPFLYTYYPLYLHCK